MIDARELFAVFGVILVMVGGWLIAPGFGLMVIGLIILGLCTYLGAEGN